MLINLIENHLDELGFARCYSWTQWPSPWHINKYIAYGNLIKVMNQHNSDTSMIFYEDGLSHIIRIHYGIDDLKYLDLHDPNSLKQLDDIITRDD